jgi:hypothetical protein
MPLAITDLTFGTPLEGVEPSLIVTVVAAQPTGGSGCTLYYQRPDGSNSNRLLSAELPEGMKEELRAALEKAATENGVNTLGFE